MRKPKLLPTGALEEAAACLKVMAHPARLQIVEVLMQGNFPVHKVAELCGLPPQQACQHLRLLLGYGLLVSERRGRAVYYKIASPRLPRLLECIRRTCSL